MKMMLDNSTTVIHTYRTSEKLDILQLRTPLTQYARDSLNIICYGMDNGAFSAFNENRFERMAIKAKTDDLCMWIVMPDVVCDHFSTAALFQVWKKRLDMNEKLAFVAQNGCNVEINPPPWSEIDCLFIGGDDDFKESPDAFNLAIEARKKGIWVHVGRVNTPGRICYWYDVADSFDGSGIARFDHMKARAFRILKKLANSRQTRISRWA